MKRPARRSNRLVCSLMAVEVGAAILAEASAKGVKGSRGIVVECGSQAVSFESAKGAVLSLCDKAGRDFIGKKGLPLFELKLLKEGAPLLDVLVANEVYLFGNPSSLGIQEIPQLDPFRPLLRKGIVAALNDKSHSFSIVLLIREAAGGRSLKQTVTVTDGR